MPNIEKLFGTAIGLVVLIGVLIAIAYPGIADPIGAAGKIVLGLLLVGGVGSIAYLVLKKSGG
jgi:hypothetical protein